MQKNKLNLITFLVLQCSVAIMALSSVFNKLASKYELLSKNFIIYYAIAICLLGIYAIVWQQIIKKTDISIAYANKATIIFWSMLFAYLFFKEEITIKNIIGVIIIFVGVLVVNKND